MLVPREESQAVDQKSPEEASSYPVQCTTDGQTALCSNLVVTQIQTAQPSRQINTGNLIQVTIENSHSKFRGYPETQTELLQRFVLGEHIRNIGSARPQQSCLAHIQLGDAVRGHSPRSGMFTLSKQDQKETTHEVFRQRAEKIA